MEIRCKHPLYDKTEIFEMDEDTTLKQLQERLIKEGFIPVRRGGYHFIINNELCALNNPVTAYMEDPDAGTVDVRVTALLNILI